MKKIITLFSFFILVSVLQAKNIAPVFIAMPDYMLVGVSLEQRKALITEVNDSAEIVVQNAMGDEIKRLEYADDFISVQTSPAGVLQIKLLPLVNNSQIIGVITTVCGRACDSEISFFTTDWQPLSKSDLMPEINKDSFFKDDIDRNSENFKNAYASLNMTPVVLSFSVPDQKILAVYDIKKYLSKDDYKNLTPFLKENALTFTWDKFAFK